MAFFLLRSSICILLVELPIELFVCCAKKLKFGHFFPEIFDLYSSCSFSNSIVSPLLNHITSYFPDEQCLCLAAFQLHSTEDSHGTGSGVRINNLTRGTFPSMKNNLKKYPKMCALAFPHYKSFFPTFSLVNAKYTRFLDYTSPDMLKMWVTFYFVLWYTDKISDKISYSRVTSFRCTCNSITHIRDISIQTFFRKFIR